LIITTHVEKQCTRAFKRYENNHIIGLGYRTVEPWKATLDII